MHLSIQLQRFDEAREWFRNALSHKVDNALLRANAYYLAFLTSDSAGMAEQQEWFANHPDDGSLGFRLASDTEAYAGHLSKANELTMRSINSSLRMENKDDAATGWEAAAVRDAAFGRPAEARRDAEKGLSLASTSRGVKAQAALAFALAGDTGRSESLVRDINKRWPLDTQIQSLWLPTIHAQLALDRNKPRNALNSLQAAYPVELGFSCLYSTYVRGEAYLAVGQGRAAADEFQRILDHSGIVSNCWTGALARLGVARANTLQARTLQGKEADGARMRALAGYETFFTLWKDADPNLSILKQAKAEYAKLR
jgi:predicted Zn-dependent protease